MIRLKHFQPPSATGSLTLRSAPIFEEYAHENICLSIALAARGPFEHLPPEQASRVACQAGKSGPKKLISNNPASFRRDVKFFPPFAWSRLQPRLTLVQ
jgi:hypothetical protein